ncbi:Fc.00g015770.m01.CDS01 [Cosmosporella sp. VM-42]
MSTTEVIHAYRRLYRSLLKAVQYTIPARFVARDQLRAAFREPGAAYDEEGIKRTVWFLKAAALETGLEHKILKNLVRVRASRDHSTRTWKQALSHQERMKKHPLSEQRQTAWKHYDMTVAMLNETIGTRLR